jgi:hypothetical protein
MELRWKMRTALWIVVGLVSWTIVGSFVLALFCY